MKRGPDQQAKRRAMGLMISAIMVAALMVAPLPSASAGEKTVRSGTIVTGGSILWYFVGDQLDGCEMAPDCRVWLETGCDPALTGRDVGLTASIEDVADLADGRSRWRVEIVSRQPQAAMAEIQFWGQDCAEIRRSRWRSGGCDLADRSEDYCRSGLLRIPASARWMTVTGYPYLPWLAEVDPESYTLNWTLIGPVARRRH